MHTQPIEYRDGQTVLEGFLAYDSAANKKQPTVLVFHDWSGRNEFACQKAEQLAKLGYVGFAVDMYGKGITGQTTEEKSQLIQPFMENRAFLQQRMLAALETVKTLEMVDTTQIGAIGFCFGGLCALDLARSGADIKGVVSFHGLLGAPTGIAKANIKAKVLALHGHDDPLAPPAQVTAFQNEMTAAHVDWQMDIYSHTQHAFTNPQANDTQLGLIYNKRAAQRSWLAMENFFAELFDQNG